MDSRESLPLIESHKVRGINLCSCMRERYLIYIKKIFFIIKTGGNTILKIAIIFIHLLFSIHSFNILFFSLSLFLFGCTLSYPNFWPKLSLTRVGGPYVHTQFNLINLCISVKISAERYFKIPHYSSESGPLLSVFLFLLYF